MPRPPLHLGVADTLREQIGAGLYRQGERLPSEESLARQLNVSRVTLREALSLLEREGIISRRHGAGNFVERPPGRIGTELSRLEPFASGIQRAGFTAREEILALAAVTLPGQVAIRLGLTPPVVGFRLEMLRRQEQVPVVYSCDYLAPGVIDPAEFQRHGRNVLDYFAATGRPAVAHSLLTVKAALPGPQEHAVLACAEQEPLVQLEGVAYSAEGRALYLTRFLIRTQYYELTLLRQ